MANKGDVVSSFDVDDNLALQLWTNGKAPRLVIFNKNKGSKKMTRMGWAESTDRKLTISAKQIGKNFSYQVADFVPGLRKILNEYVQIVNFKIRFWKFANELKRIIHTPEVVTDKGELKLLPEDKRSALWIADCTDSADHKEGVFRPFFTTSNAEVEKALRDETSRKVTAAKRDVDTFLETGTVQRLLEVRPDRWFNPLRVTAAAMLLDFTYCDEDGTELSDELWENAQPEYKGGKAQKSPGLMLNDLKLSLTDQRLKGLLVKLTAFTRHYELVPNINESISLDSDKDMLEQGYARTRRLPFPAGMIGNVGYKVTTFLDEANGKMALGCKPESATSRHTGELVYTFPIEDYKRAQTDDTMDGPADEFFTITQLVRAKQFSNWMAKVTNYIHPFAGLMYTDRQQGQQGQQAQQN